MLQRAIVLLLLVAGCTKKEPPAGNQYQVPIGGRADEQPRLGFKIVQVYEKQKPTASGHEAGGEWTFFDAETPGAAKLTFGFHGKGGSDSFSFGDAWLAVPDRASGEKFVGEFARAFRVTAPPPGAPLPLAPMKFGVAILGQHTGRMEGGGYGGSGSWTATKLFPEIGEMQAEVFFNFSLADKAGEFAEKDADYDKELALLWAKGLRDGVAK